MISPKHANGKRHRSARRVNPGPPVVRVEFRNKEGFIKYTAELHLVSDEKRQYMSEFAAYDGSGTVIYWDANGKAMSFRHQYSIDDQDLPGLIIHKKFDGRYRYFNYEGRYGEIGIGCGGADNSRGEVPDIHVFEAKMHELNKFYQRDTFLANLNEPDPELKQAIYDSQRVRLTGH